MENEKIANVSDSTYDPINNYKLKWHQFIVAMLSIGSFLEFLVCLLTFFGKGNSALSIRFPDLSNVHPIWGLIRIVFLVLSIVALYKLANFKAFGIVLLKLLIIALPLINVCYVFIFAMKSKVSFFEAHGWNSIVQVVVGCILLLINTIYYNKRKEIFD